MRFFSVIDIGGTISAKNLGYPFRPLANVITHKLRRPVLEWFKQQPDKRADFRYYPLCPVDSKKIGFKEFKHIIRLICASPDNDIILTMGTDRIVTVARRLAKIQSLIPGMRHKRIFVVGAMLPLDHPLSDGPANLAYARHFILEDKVYAHGGVVIVLGEPARYLEGRINYLKPLQPRCYEDPFAVEKIYKSDLPHRSYLRAVKQPAHAALAACVR